MREPILDTHTFYVTSDGEEHGEWCYAMDWEIQQSIVSIMDNHGIGNMEKDIVIGIQKALLELSALCKEAESVYAEDAARSFPLADNSIAPS